MHLDRALPTQPISKFRQSGTEVLDHLEEGPVMLTQHGMGAGVLLSIDLYNSMVSIIRSFNDSELARNRIREMDDERSAYLTQSEFDETLQQRGLLDGA
ncbi:MAG: type II toxin-antitoxin system Phd/YefM family antitoxin [Caldilineaceae bacterium]|nr:type II toxin-antitoxin system Phd/YefM family antitoxin [Caldilineaceae bacterium]